MTRILILGYEEEPSQIVGLVPFEDGTVKCLTCGKTVSSMRSARRHYTLVHATDRSDRRYKCQICHVDFAVESYRDDHMRVRHGITKSMMKNRVMPFDQNASQ